MKLTLPKPPSVNALYRTTCRNGYPSVYMTAEGRDYYDTVGIYVKQHYRLKKPMEGQISLYVKLYYFGRYDWDNCLKVTGDLLTKCGIIKDDSLIVFGQVEKIKASSKKDQKIEIEIVEE